jgi:hypothetical protein
MKLFSKFYFKNLKHFSVKYEGIKGDVNWVDGKLVDGRPNIRRKVFDLPKRKYGNLDMSGSEYSQVLKELNENKIFLTYNTRKIGVGKVLDIKYDRKK